MTTNIHAAPYMHTVIRRLIGQKPYGGSLSTSQLAWLLSAANAAGWWLTDSSAPYVFQDAEGGTIKFTLIQSPGALFGAFKIERIAEK